MNAETRKQEMLRKLQELNAFGLFLVELMIDYLLFREWVESIPVRWVKWLKGAHE